MEFYATPLITTLTRWGSFCVPMTLKTMLTGAMSPGGATHVRQVER